MIDIKGLPWLFKGVRDVVGCTTAREVMEAAKLDFSVAKCEIVAKMPNVKSIGSVSFSPDNYDDDDLDDDSFIHGDSIFRTVDNQYATYRTDTNKPLGLVKSKYEIVQNLDAFNFFDEAIGNGDAIWQTAGCFDGGRRIFVSAKLPNTITVNGKDHIENYLVFTNSHDGSSGVNIMFTPIRIVCQNCLSAARRQADQFIRFRHTESIHGRISDAANILGIAREHEITAEIMYNKMAAKKMTDIEVMDYIASIHLNADEYNKTKAEPNGLTMLFYRNKQTIDNIGLSTRKVNMLSATMDYYQSGPGQKEIAGTAWGAYNAITGYYSNVANLVNEKRMDSLLYGNAGNVMNSALNKIAI